MDAPLRGCGTMRLNSDGLCRECTLSLFHAILFIRRKGNGAIVSTVEPLKSERDVAYAHPVVIITSAHPPRMTGGVSREHPDSIRPFADGSVWTRCSGPAIDDPTRTGPLEFYAKSRVADPFCWSSFFSLWSRSYFEFIFRASHVNP